MESDGERVNSQRGKGEHKGLTHRAGDVLLLLLLRLLVPLRPLVADIFWQENTART